MGASLFGCIVSFVLCMRASVTTEGTDQSKKDEEVLHIARDIPTLASNCASAVLACTKNDITSQKYS